MSRACYADYVRRMMRFYVSRTTLPDDVSAVDLNNWQICDRIMSLVREPQRSILADVYQPGSIVENVESASVKYRVARVRIWELVKRHEKMVAKERGLI